MMTRAILCSIITFIRALWCVVVFKLRGKYRVGN
jgi:hypothetical protein